MKTSIPAAVAAFAIAAGAPALAAASDSAAGWYAAGTVGIAVPGDAPGTYKEDGVKFDLGLENGVGLNAAVGYDMGALRVEGALSWIRADIDSFEDSDGKAAAKGEASALGVMANGWFDIDTGSAVTPFVGGGVGMARISGKLDQVGGEADDASDSGWAFAWRVGAGLAYDLGNGAAAQFGWRYFDPAEVDYDEEKWDLDGIHILEVGIRIGF